MTTDLTDLLRQLDASLSTKKIPGAFSSAEMAGIVGCSGSRASALVKRLIAAGLAEYAGREQRRTIIGSISMTPVYRRVKQGKMKA